MSEFTLHHGNCLDILKTLPDSSIDSIVTDPPYGLKFMGRKWDYDVPAVEVWAECLRVLKPGGHLLAFAGTRTQHRMAARIEDAGFEIRDMIAWVYGSGFPKSLNVSKAIESGGGRPEDIRRMQMGEAYKPSGRGRINYDHGAGSAMDAGAASWHPSSDAARQWQGWGTALKPAMEPITVARKPLIGTVAENVLQYKTGAMNIDGCRVETSENLNGGAYAKEGGRSESQSLHAGSGMNQAGKTAGREFVQPAGRWPANLIHDGSEEVLDAFPQAPGQLAKAAEGGDRRKDQNVYGSMTRGSNGSEPRDESGKSAARFFKSAEYSHEELLFCRAKAVIEAWNTDLANTVDSSSYLPSQLAASVLSDAVTVAAHGVIALSELKGLSTSVTPSELRRLSETLIGTILSIASGSSPASQPERLFPNGCLASVAGTNAPTDTTTITVNRWKSGGSAAPVTFSITPLNWEHGVKGLNAADRLRYCAKASKSDRGEGNTHPTVKPTSLMRYLCRLVTPAGGVVLDPFMGSGSTGKASVMEGFRFVGIELDQAFIEVAKGRISSANAETP